MREESVSAPHNVINNTCVHLLFRVKMVSLKQVY